jgi:hypothetical protein
VVGDSVVIEVVDNAGQSEWAAVGVVSDGAMKSVTVAMTGWPGYATEPVNANVAKIGNVCQFLVTAGQLERSYPGDRYVVGTLPSGFRPLLTVQLSMYPIELEGSDCHIELSGDVMLRSFAPTDIAWVYATATYATKN